MINTVKTTLEQMQLVDDNPDATDPGTPPMKQLDFVEQAETAPKPATSPSPSATTSRKTAAGKPRRRNRPAGSREDMQRLNMEIPRALHKRLKLKAIYEDRTVTDLVLQAINDYLHSH
jgi:hypothetical protein